MQDAVHETLIIKIKFFFLSWKDLEKIFHALIFSRLDSCNSLNYGVQTKILDRLQMVKNTSARLLSSTHKYYHVNFKILLFVFKSLHGPALLYIAYLIQDQNFTISVTESFSSSKDESENKRSVPLQVLAQGYGTIYHNIRLSSTLSEFKRHLKTFFFFMLVT